jgi:hypothetical protein
LRLADRNDPGLKTQLTGAPVPVARRHPIRTIFIFADDARGFAGRGAAITMIRRPSLATVRARIALGFSPILMLLAGIGK